MEVTVEGSAGLERRVRVQIPEDRVQGEIDKRLHNMARSVRVPGFRPGKVPVKVVAQRYGRQVRDEVVGEIVQSSFVDAISQEQLRPAGMPTIEPLESAPGEGLSYTAVFDVYPEVTLPEFDSLTVARPTCDITDADVDAMIETLRRQRRTWRTVERPASETDRVVVDFQGRVDGEELEQGKGTEVPVELNAGWMVPGFEAGLVGTEAGEDRTLEVRFPEPYANEQLAGRAATFQVHVHRVEEPVLPDVDDEFAASFGVKEGGVEAFRTEVRGNMARELDDAVSNATKQRVMEALLGGESLDLPRSLVDQEIERSVARRRVELSHSGIDPQSVNLEPAMFEEQARRRVTLGLLLAEIIKSKEIEVDAARVRARIETIASTYEDAQEVIAWYYSDRERLSDVESAVLEEQVVEWILERADVREDPTSFDALMNPGQTTSDAPN